MTARPRTTARIATLALLAGCAPEPATAVEIRQTVVEILDLGRAMAIEHALVDLTTTLDLDQPPAQLAAAVRDSAALVVPCATVSAAGKHGVRVNFGAEPGCVYAGREFVGIVDVDYSVPTPGAPLAVLTYLDVGSGGALLTGSTQVTSGPDSTRRLASELRLDSPEPRQIEIQADRIQRTYRGALQIDGWLNWQTLLGRWKMELGGWEQARDALVPGRGVAQISTPYNHDVIVDFTGPVAEGLELRANGGRRDLVFAIAADGEIVELGED